MATKGPARPSYYVPARLVKVRLNNMGGPVRSVKYLFGKINNN